MGSSAIGGAVSSTRLGSDGLSMTMGSLTDSAVNQAELASATALPPSRLLSSLQPARAKHKPRERILYIAHPAIGANNVGQFNYAK
jgi:hypothetical protein